jgi:hypothetical protein
MAILGMTNSRLKDFYDLHELAMHRDFDGAIMAAAIRSTFERRHTSIHPEQLQSLLALFGKDAGKQRQWQGFLRKSRLITAPQELAVAVEAIAHFLGPILEKIGSRSSFSGKWLAGGPWEPGSDPDP